MCISLKVHIKPVDGYFPTSERLFLMLLTVSKTETVWSPATSPYAETSSTQPSSSTTPLPVIMSSEPTTTPENKRTRKYKSKTFTKSCCMYALWRHIKWTVWSLLYLIFAVYKITCVKFTPPNETNLQFYPCSKPVTIFLCLFSNFHQFIK